MKKKILLFTVLVLTLVCLFAVVSSAEEMNPEYNQDYVKAMTSTMTSVTLENGTTVPLYDEQGYTLCYYWEDVSTKTTLLSVRTKDLTFGFNGTRLSSISLGDKQLAGTAHKGVIVVVNLRGLKNSKGEEMTDFNGDNLFKENSPLEYIFMPDSIEYLTNYAFGFRDASLSHLRGCYFSENSKLKKIASFTFGNCKQLRGFYIPEGVTSVESNGFQGCNNVFFVQNANDPLTKPDVYYFPKNLNTAVDEAFDTCKNLNNILVFPASGITMGNNWCFENVQNGNGGKPTIVFLGDVNSISISYWNVNAIYFANANDIDATSAGVSGSKTMYFCHAQGNTTHLVEKNLGTPATCITNETVETYCFCTKLVEKTEKENTATGIHTWSTNDCTVSVKCTGDDKCTAMSVANADHALVHTLVYANGFDKTGLYNCYCTVDNCTMAGKEIIDGEKAPIITFLGYSVPETAGVKGINAGFKVEKDLLNDYNDINDVDATLTLFMVNSKNDEVNISKIFKDGTLDLETGVKGINVAITSTSYTNISVEVRGFDDSTEKGNYYTLKLITAIAVKTEEGTHFVQAGLKTGNDKQAVDGVDFNIVSADKVYSAVAQ